MRHHAHSPVTHLRQQSEQLLASLGLSSAFAFGDLHQRMEAGRGRQIHLIPRELPLAAPHGLWVAAESADYVFYAANATRVRQLLIIGHEYGHMMFDDASTPAELEQVVALLMPSVDPSVPRVMLARSTYDEPIEQRAEVFATVALQHAQSWSDIPVSDPVDPAVSARLISTLEGRPAW